MQLTGFFKSFIAIYLLYFISMPPNVLAKNAKTALKSSENYFFPYSACVLAKISEFKLANDTNCKVANEFVAKVSILRVLRGEFKPGEVVQLKVSRELVKYMNDCQEHGKKADGEHLIAFNYFKERKGTDLLISVSNLYCPLRRKEFTETAIKTLAKKLESSLYSRRYCLAITVLKMEDKKVSIVNLNGCSNIRLATVRVDENLLQEQSDIGKTITRGEQVKLETGPSVFFKVGEVFTCYLGESVEESLFPKGSQNDRAGAKCIWSFNTEQTHVGPNETVLQLIDLHAPFPYQLYTSIEMAKLRERLALNSKYLGDLALQVQRYIRKEVPLEVLQSFCQPESRCSGVFRRFPINSNNRVLYSEFHLPRNQPSRGHHTSNSAMWFANIVNGVPEAYEILVDEGNGNRWLYHAPFTLRRASGDQMFQERLFQTLQYSILNYESEHFEDGLAAELRNLALIGPGVLLRDPSGKVLEFRCCLTDGQMLKVRLNKNLKIEDVLISDIPSDVMKRAINTTVENFDKIIRRKLQVR